MKIDRISFNTTIPIDAYGINDRMGAEGELEENEDPINAMRELILFVETARNKKYPHLYRSNSEFQPVTVDFTPKEKPEEIRIGDIENDIRSCKELLELETYKLIVKQKPQFKAVYDEMYSQLTQNQTTTK